MTFVVRTEDGELKFGTLQELERAFAQGLVDEEDEVRRGEGEWRRVSELPELVSVRSRPRGGLGQHGTGRWYLTALVVLVLGLAFLLIPMPPAVMLLLMVAASLGLYSYLTWGAFRRKGRRLR